MAQLIKVDMMDRAPIDKLPPDTGLALSLPENILSVSSAKRCWNGITVNVTEFNCNGRVSHKLDNEAQTRLSVILEEVGQHAEPRLRRDRPCPVGYTPKHMLYAPAGLEVWGYSDDCRYVRDATLTFDPAQVAEKLGVSFESALFSTPRLRLVDHRVWTLVELLANAVGDPDPSLQLYGDGLSAAIMACLFTRRKEVSTVYKGLSPLQFGPVADNARSARLSHEIWQEHVNRNGGLLGRSVELICRDDFSDASKVPEIYRQLMDEEKVDLVIGGYGTNSVAPALPAVVERQRFFVGLQGLGVNDALAYPGYFAMIPTGPDPNPTLTEGFFALAAQQHPRPATVALVSADALFAKNPVIGAKANAEKYGFKLVHEATYPLATKDFTSIIDDVAKSDCDLLFICSYLDDSIGIVRAIHASPFRPKMVGASMIGPQTAAVKAALGPLLNGFVNYEYWAPVPSMMFAGASSFLDAYQARAVEKKVDLLGHYTPLLAYAQMQVLAQAVEATGGIEDARLSAYAREATFDTVMGPIRFGRNGEWAEPRVLQVQFQGIEGHELAQFQKGLRQVVVWPPEHRSGVLKYPFADALGT